jgi:hypothetical protein
VFASQVDVSKDQIPRVVITELMGAIKRTSGRYCKPKKHINKRTSGRWVSRFHESIAESERREKEITERNFGNVKQFGTERDDFEGVIAEGGHCKQALIKGVSYEKGCYKQPYGWSVYFGGPASTQGSYGLGCSTGSQTKRIGDE